jgi:hypothetical protein
MQTKLPQTPHTAYIGTIYDGQEDSVWHESSDTLESLLHQMRRYLDEEITRTLPGMGHWTVALVTFHKGEIDRKVLQMGAFTYGHVKAPAKRVQ